MSFIKPKTLLVLFILSYSKSYKLRREYFTEPLQHLVVKQQFRIIFVWFSCFKHILGSICEVSQEEICFAASQKYFCVFFIHLSLTVGLKSILKCTIFEQQMACQLVNVFVIRTKSYLKKLIPMKLWRSLKARAGSPSIWRHLARRT